MPRQERRLDRRSALALAGAAVAAVGAGAHLAAQGVRLEHDAPGPEVLPREEHPGVPALRAELARCAEAAAAAAALAGSRAPASGGRSPGTVTGDSAFGGRWAAVHADQVEALGSRLREISDAPEDRARPTAVGPREPGPAGGVRAVDRAQARTRLLAAEAAGRTASDLAVIARAPGADRRLVASTSIARAGAALLLRPRTPGDPLTATAPALVGLPEAVRHALLSAARSGEYGLQVAAAQAGPATAPHAKAALAVTTRLGGDLLATLAGTAPSPSLGYRLPVDVVTPDRADQVGRDVLDALVAGIVEAARAAPAAGLGALLVRGAEIEAARVRWGSRPRPLPGLG